jgi:hypothetical protein
VKEVGGDIGDGDRDRAHPDREGTPLDEIGTKDAHRANGTTYNATSTNREVRAAEGIGRDAARRHRKRDAGARSFLDQSIVDIEDHQFVRTGDEQAIAAVRGHVER